MTKTGEVEIFTQDGTGLGAFDTATLTVFDDHIEVKTEIWEKDPHTSYETKYLPTGKYKTISYSKNVIWKITEREGETE